MTNSSGRPELDDQFLEKRYALLAKLSEDEGYVYYVAADERLKRQVAIKMLKTDCHSSKVASIRLQAEAELMAAIRYRGIPVVFDFAFLNDGRPFMVSDLIMGMSARHLIEVFDRSFPNGDPERNPRLGRCLLALEEACRILNHAHLRGVLHRDIQLTNIVFEGDEIYVVNWSNARYFRGPQTSNTLKELSEIAVDRPMVGSPPIGMPIRMAPEEFERIENATPLSEVYSLGICLFELLVGRHPFSETIVEVIQEKLTGDFKSPHQFDPTVNPTLEGICLKAMATRPQDRYPDANALGIAIASWRRGQPVPQQEESVFAGVAKMFGWGKRRV